MKITKDEYTSFPQYIDSTMFSSMKGCSRSFFNRYCRKLSFAEQSIHLIAGAAIAKGFEVTRKAFIAGQHPDEAIERGVFALLDAYGDFESDKAAKSPYGMVRAFISYWQEYGTLTDYLKPAKLANGKSAIEYNFRIPLPINNPDTGKPLIFTGRLDMLAIKDGQYYIVDEKTTGALSTVWATQWDMRGQFLAYAWACRQEGIPVVGAIVRGIGIYKTMIKHQEVIVQTPQWKTDRWYKELLSTVSAVVASYEASEFGYAFSDACNSYSGCSFKNLCNVRNEEVVLPTYNRVVWRPEIGEQEVLYMAGDSNAVPDDMANAFEM